MKKNFAIALFAALNVMRVTAQTETFDIATFIAPSGWQRLDSNGVVAFYDFRTANGLESVMVNIAGSDYASTIHKFFNNLNLDSKAIVTSSQQGKISSTNQNIMTGTITMNDYDFVAPEGWQVQKNTDAIRIQNMKSGCLILLLPPQSSSATLEEETGAAFDLMYKGWQPQNTGSKKYDLYKGFLAKGLEYCKIEAKMNMTGADGRYQLEEGAACVVRVGNQSVIIAERHNSSLLDHDECWKKYETCQRFFNSFTVKNVSAPKDNGVAHSQRIVGVWKIVANGPVAGDYVFAANGHYQFDGAIGTSSTSSDFKYEYLHITSYAWQGDGTYAINGGQLTMNGRAGNKAEQVRYRFAQINHGGTGWKDRIYLLKVSDVDGKEYEVCYEKEDPKEK